MKSFVGFILALIFITLFACEKEPSSNVIIPKKTVHPRPYFPVYPGSWWKYEINKKDTVVRSTSEKYIPHSYWKAMKYVNGIQVIDSTEVVLVPFYDGEPIYGYDEIRQVFSGNGVMYRSPLLRDKVGTKFIRGGYNHHFPELSETVTVEEKFFNGSDTVIVLKGRWFSDLLMPHHVYEEFAKDKGLIKRYHVLNSNSDTIYSEELIDHYINQF